MNLCSKLLKPPPGESQLEDIKSTTLGVYEGAGEILLLRPWVC